MLRSARPRVVLAWMPVSQRSATLARCLDAQLVLLADEAGFRKPWTALVRYPRLIIRTWTTLMRLRPASILVVAPPVVAPLVVLPLARMMGCRVAIDIHTGALLDRRWLWSTPLLRLLVRRADAGVVTLESLADRLGTKARAIVLPDPLPDLGDEVASVVHSPPEVVAVCGWGADEPIDELVESARGRQWRLTLTGRPRWTPSLPENVHLSGFLAEGEYRDLLRTADAIVVLTTREETLLSGAWEAIALAKPLVVSDTVALRATFGPETACAGPATESIRAAIERVLGDGSAHERARQLRQHFVAASDVAVQALSRVMESAHGAGDGIDSSDVERG